jgi:hypothetical protein
MSITVRGGWKIYSVVAGLEVPAFAAKFPMPH